ncbi:MAG: transketolase [Chloroflexi bacterium]|nr:MAG: transketolase [Chloroflexota bacterium]
MLHEAINSALSVDHLKPQKGLRPAAPADFPLTDLEIIEDYRIAYASRQFSRIGRQEVLNGRAQFGIFGGGKEVPQVALAHAFQKGDFRSGYYRDQTLLLALGLTDLQGLFAHLYADPNPELPLSAGSRQTVCHFNLPFLNKDGSWKNLTERFNNSADVSPTGSQMPRLVGLGYASRLYRELDELKPFTQFSNNGNEVAFGTIGDGSAAEGLFWESINAIAILHAPVVLSIWDDGFGISVPNHLQIAKGNLSEVLAGFQRTGKDGTGFDIYTVYGWDYPSLVQTYRHAARQARRHHIPAIVHVIELTQPFGHSTSGSHERYKTKARLEWEAEHDGLARMRQWILDSGIATEGQLTALEEAANKELVAARDAARREFYTPIERDRSEAVALISRLENETAANTEPAEQLARIRQNLADLQRPQRRQLVQSVWDALLAASNAEGPARDSLAGWYNRKLNEYRQSYRRHLHNDGPGSALRVPEVPAVYSDNSPSLPGFQILNTAFKAMFARDPRVITFGEDTGHIGGVNQTMAGMQERFGPLRVSDTGIREATIIGQAIGLAMRGLRPIAEIQYLDYLLVGLQIMADDLATLRWRTSGGQKAPVIVRTRGHRLVGMWHAGSPLAGIINLVRGMHVLVPRNMVQAAGFYNTLLQSDEPALVIEVLNGYRLKETLPDNIAEFTVPLGVPEILRPGQDVTVVTYGANCAIALEAAEALARFNIDVEVIDVRSLLPFDVNRHILQSLKKTGRIVFFDEDVPGGATAYMMQQVLEAQGGFYWLDSEPVTVTSPPHRPAFGHDGMFFSKPNSDDLFRAVFELMHEAEPQTHPLFYK